MEKKPKLWTNILILAITLIVCLTILDIVVGVIAPQPTHKLLKERLMPIFQESELLPWELLPNTNITHRGVFSEWEVNVLINNKGLRDNQFNFELKEDHLKLLCLGDSFALGYGVEYDESYCSLTAEMLEKSTGKKIQAINAAYASGYTYDTAYLFLRENIDLYTPDLVVFGFFYGNDLGDALSHTYVYNENNKLTKIISPSLFINDNHQREVQQLDINIPLLNPIHKFLNKNSNLYVLTKNIFKPSILRSLTPPALNSLYYNNEDTDKLWQKSVPFLAKMNAICKENNCNFIILQIPGKDEVDNKRFEEMKYALNLDPELTDWDHGNNKLKEICNENNLTCIYILDQFRKLNKDNSFYFNMDGHWNREGHKFASTILAQELSEALT